MSSFETGKYYDITYCKNREGSNQLKLDKSSPLATLLLKEINHPRPCFSKLPFWIHGEDVWLEVHQSTNLPTRVDRQKVIFIADPAGKVLCHFKKMEPFSLKHYLSESVAGFIEDALNDEETLKCKNIPKKTIKKQHENLNAVCFWKDHPTRVGEKKVDELLAFYKSIQ